MRLPVAFALLLTSFSWAQDQSGNYPLLPRWCGKTYEQAYPSFEPGGQTVEPPKVPRGWAVNLQLKPRYSIYVEGDTHGEFLINTEISKWHGKPWPKLKSPSKSPKIAFNITGVDSGVVLIQDEIKVNTKFTPFRFSFEGITPRYDPYRFKFLGGGGKGQSRFFLTTEMYYLPRPKGSATRIDNINGTMYFRSNATQGAWQVFMPFGLYGDCEGFLCETMEVQKEGGDRTEVETRANVTKIDEYQALGFNSMVALAHLKNETRDMFERMNKVDMRFMYDLRGFYRNYTEVTTHVLAIKDSQSLYAYWVFDQPDAHQDPFLALPKAREHIQRLDPYHPIAVTLDCQNFYFKEYSAAADIIMDDTYPLTKNRKLTYSDEYGTPCNTSYGNCGCDNCRGSVMDVYDRFTDYKQYELWNNLWPKPKMHAVQGVTRQHWRRPPYDNEATTMAMLGFHAGATMATPWHYPTEQRLASQLGRFARMVTSERVSKFLLTRKPRFLEINAYPYLQVAYWRHGNETLLSVVNPHYHQVRPLEYLLPLPWMRDADNFALDKVFWGDAMWQVERLHEHHYQIRFNGLKSVSVNLMLFNSTHISGSTYPGA